MSAANRTAIFTKIQKVLRKHYDPVAPPSDRSVLEHLLYACVLEHARHDAVDDVFARLQKNYFDWNEVRVTSVPELAEGMANIPDAMEASKRLKRALQSVFETHYVFDIEFLRKQGLAKAVETIERYGGVTPFIVSYVTQNAFAGHSIPVNAHAMSLFVIVGAMSAADAAKNRMPGLERAIPKNKGMEFGSLLHQLAVDYAVNPQSAKVKGIVSEIDPQARERLPKKVSRTPPAPPARRPATSNRPVAETKPLRPDSAEKPAVHPVAKEPPSESKKDMAALAGESKRGTPSRLTRKKPK